MVAVLKTHPDFMATKPLLVELIEKISNGRWTVVFLPKFHCEARALCNKQAVTL